MKLTKDQTDTLERVHKAFNEFNEAVRALGVKGFKLRIARAEKGAFHPFEVKSIVYSQPLTMQDVKEAIADRMRNEGATQAPQKPTGATNGVCDAQEASPGETDTSHVG